MTRPLSHWISYRILLPGAITLATLTAGAQKEPSPAAPQAAALPVFDVAAIHPHEPLPHEGSSIDDTNGRFITINVTLRSIMQWAFDVPQSRIVGGPSWIHSDRWDIEAKADDALDMQKTFDPPAALLQKRQMVQSLLKNRFGLTYHYATRVLPVYVLVVAKDGPKFLSTKANGTTINRARDHIGVQGGDDTVAILAEQLAETLGRVVLDKTGIEGRYNIHLTWTPDDRAAPPAGGSAGASAEPVSSGPSIFTALQEQLGLKLDAQRAPVQVLVIDHVELASAN